MDDISLSSNDLEKLKSNFALVRAALEKSGFPVNNEKTCVPCEAMHIFNCDLQQNMSKVTEERKKKFFSVGRTVASEKGFTEYCVAVESGNKSDLL